MTDLFDSTVQLEEQLIQEGVSAGLRLASPHNFQAKQAAPIVHFHMLA